MRKFFPFDAETKDSQWNDIVKFNFGLLIAMATQNKQIFDYLLNENPEFWNQGTIGIGFKIAREGEMREFYKPILNGQCIFKLLASLTPGKQLAFVEKLLEGIQDEDTAPTYDILECFYHPDFATQVLARNIKLKLFDESLFETLCTKANEDTFYDFRYILEKFGGKMDMFK